MLDTERGFFGFYLFPHIVFDVLPSDSSRNSSIGLFSCVHSHTHSIVHVIHPYPSLYPPLVLYPTAWLASVLPSSSERVLSTRGEATTELIRKVIRDGMYTEKVSTTEEIYKYNEYIILDASWGQYTKGNTDQTKTAF